MGALTIKLEDELTFRELYLSRAEVANEYPISVRKLVELHKFAELPALMINGKSFYLRKDVDDYFLRLAKHARSEADRDQRIEKKKAGRPTKAREVAARKKGQGIQYAA